MAKKLRVVQSSPPPTPEPPVEYRPFLGSYGAVVHDGGVAIGWGFPILKQMSREMFDAFPGCPVLVSFKQNMGFYALMGQAMGDWVFVIKWLKPEEAEKQYGAVTKIKVGPRGGWRGVFYGTVEFCNRQMDPRGIIPCPEPVVED